MKRGFSLIEVLAALLLVSIVLPIVMHGYDVTTSMATLARQRTEAAALADSQLSRLVASGDWSKGVLNGDFAPEQPDYRWTAEVVSWDNGTSTTLSELDVKVSWTWRGQEREFVVSTLVDQATTDTGTTLGQ
jgi:prepilin-type N-terminal cleavage/methylation domain-containing protein